MRTLEQDRSVLVPVRLPTLAVLTTASVVLLFAAAAFWLQPAPESPPAKLQTARLSPALVDADQRSQESGAGVALAPSKGLNDKPKIAPFVLPSGACRLVHDAEGNTEGQCDLHEVGPAVSDAGQSPFGTGQWAPPQVQRTQ